MEEQAWLLRTAFCLLWLRRLQTQLEWQFCSGDQKPVSGPGSSWSQPRNIRRVPLESPEGPAALAKEVKAYQAMATAAVALSTLQSITYPLISSPFYFISLFSFPIVASKMVGLEAGGRKGRGWQLQEPRPPPQCPWEMHMAPRDENNTLFKLFWWNDRDPRVTNISGTAPFFP